MADCETVVGHNPTIAKGIQDSLASTFNISPIFAAVTICMGRNIYWADGSYTNLLGKTRKGKPAQAPEEAHKIALENLERLRAEGKIPYPED